jgi:addiction module HigA family antidote
MSYERKGPAAWAMHPGEVLKKEFLKPMKLSGYALAKALNVTAQRVSDIVLKKTGISADMAIRLGRFFGMSPEFWMNLQASYELALAEKTLKKQINKIKPRQVKVA